MTDDDHITPQSGEDKAEAFTSMPDAPEVSDLEDQAQAMRTRLYHKGDAQTPENPSPGFLKLNRSQMSSQNAGYQGLALGLNIAFFLLAAVGLGFLIGWGLDKATNSNIFLPIFGLLGMVLGAFGSYIFLTRFSPKN